MPNVNAQHHQVVVMLVSMHHQFSLVANVSYVGLARTIYIRCIYGIFGREITKYTVI
jgi:tRNA splicing endonuclease